MPGGSARTLQPFLWRASRLDADRDAVETDVRAMIEDDYPRWGVRNEVLFVEAIPTTATGKFSKRDLREEYDDASLVAGKVPEEAAPEQDD